jgi:TRAP-type C4-dicarboxylate transport system permease small subunit
MALIELKLDPTRRELRIFGLVLFPVFFALVGLMTWKIVGSLQAAVIIWSVALGITLVGLASLTFMRAVYVGWMYAAYPIGWTISHVMFATVYYLLITPIGLTMRLAGRDLLKLRLDRSSRSYWIRRKPAEDLDRYFRQF